MHQCSISRDDPRDVSTVPSVIVETAGKPVVLACVQIDPAVEIRVCRIHARIDYGDANSLTRNRDVFRYAEGGADAIHP